jgi:metal-sulfur cluster biosynthetic enzyme
VDGTESAGLKERILAELDHIKDPCSVASGIPLGLTEMGLVESVRVGHDGDVEIALRLTAPTCHMIAFMRSEAIRRLADVDGVTSVDLIGDQGLDWRPSMMTESAKAKREERLRHSRRALPLLSPG